MEKTAQRSTPPLTLTSSTYKPSVFALSDRGLLGWQVLVVHLHARSFLYLYVISSISNHYFTNLGNNLLRKVACKGVSSNQSQTGIASLSLAMTPPACPFI